MKIKLYDLHGETANNNFFSLLSPDQKYFYWDNKSFLRLTIGDYVFFMCRKNKKALLTIIEELNIIPIRKDGKNVINDLDYILYDNYPKGDKEVPFYRFKVIQVKDIPDGWNYTITKTFSAQNMQLGLYEEGSSLNKKQLSKIKDLIKIFSDGTANEILRNIQEYPVRIKDFSVKDNDLKTIQKADTLMGKTSLIQKFQSNLISKNLIYNERTIKRFISSLATKPFVILTGNSGSGKSKIAIEFAKWMNLIQQQEKKKEYVKGQILSDYSGFIWRVEKTSIKWKRIDFYRELAKPFFNLYEFKGPDDCILIADDKEYKARYTIYKDYPAIHAYKDFSKWLEHIGVGNFFKIEPIIIEGTSNNLKFKVSKISEDDKTEIIFNDEKRYSLIPVGADWTDNKSVLGYLNPLTTPESYVSTPILELIIEASKPENIDFPYFLILDEMNLSHVERYFSDFLSLIELPDQPIKLHNSTDAIYAMGNDTLQIPNQINEFPKNLFIIGTVNVDETTYMFSPKVLDRANVIEIKTTYDDLNNYANKNTITGVTQLAKQEDIVQFLECSFFSRRITNPARWKAKLTDKEYEDCKKNILNYFKVLDKYNLEFGFRTLDEALRYAQVVKEFSSVIEKNFINDVIDEQVVQKFITKLNGSKIKMGELLKELFELSYSDKWDKDLKFEDIIKSEKLAAIKLFQMIKRVNQDQFVSYI